MADFAVRKIVVQLEEIRHEGGPLVMPPPVRGAVYAICANPFAGRYIPDLQAAMEDLKPLALDLTDRLVAIMGGREGIDAYGKGALVGEAGEAEHGALWHVAGGYGMRELIIRVNGLSTAWGYADIALASRSGAAAGASCRCPP